PNFYSKIKLRYILIVLAGFIIVFVFVFLWVFMLNKRVAKKTNELAISEEKFRTLVKTLPVALMIYQNNKWVYVNKIAVEISGYSEAELLKMNYWDFIHPDYLKFIKNLGKKRQAGYKDICNRYELKIITKSGFEKWVLLSGDTTIYDGKTSAIISIIDITNQKEIEMELRANKLRFSAFMDNLPAAVYIKDENLKLLYSNIYMNEFLGADKWIGKTPEELLPTEIANEIIADDKKALDEELLIYEETLPNKNGVILDFETRKFRIDTGNGILLGGISLDITEKKNAEKELLKYREQLEELVDERTKDLNKSQKSLALLLEDVNDINRELKESNTNLNATNTELEAFSYSVSHDLRAPLTRMDGFSNALLENYTNNLDTKAIHYIKRINSSSKNMTKLIDDMLKLSRLTSKNLQKQKVNVSEKVKTVVNKLIDVFPNKKYSIAIQNDLFAYVDEAFLVILLENLLKNAFKFSQNEESPKIEFGTKFIDKRNVFFIKDNGVGFDMKYINKMFGAFQRLHSDNEFEGTGIGLAIVQRIINKHGGKIWASSELGIGSEFYFRFE
ncbi:MAG: PAS domain S-box protein, partial [Bacteroidota bacterium]|nr:PAS domain S-box protein [Bacteroidota bacterium]